MFQSSTLSGDKAEQYAQLLEQARGLMHGDRATVRIQGMDARGRPEGSLVDVLERRTHRLVGRFVRESGVNLVVPDNARYTQDVVVEQTLAFYGEVA